MAVQTYKEASSTLNFKSQRLLTPLPAAAMSAIGSDSWRGAENYEGDELHNRATNFLTSISWDALAAIASKYRNGIDCQLNEKYSLGYFNLVRRLVFKDGVSWVARLRLPLLQNSPELLRRS